MARLSILFATILCYFASFLHARSLQLHHPRSYSNTSTVGVTQDKYSLLINQERVFLFSGEFHYHRLPVPDLWLDVLQKYKANGLNAVSISFPWSYHASTPNTIDLTSGPRDVQRLLDYAKQTGLYVIAKPGPYLGSDISGGGLPLWMSDGSYGPLRTDNEKYNAAWQPWMQAIGALLAKNQITNGGPVILVEIESAMRAPGQVADTEADAARLRYVDLQKEALRNASITIPLASATVGLSSNIADVDTETVSAVDIVGLNSRPGNLSCMDPNAGFEVPRTYSQWFQTATATTPKFLANFEAGRPSSWGAEVFYDGCESEHSPEFANVFYKNNIGQQVTMMNLYMGFGGTNWGHSAAPQVYTSYDLSAPLLETREITDKFRQTKLLAYFTRAVSELRKTNLVGAGAGYGSNSSEIYAYHLKNPDLATRFYVLQHTSSPSRENTPFSMTLQTSNGNVTVNNTSLDGRQSKIVTVDLALGSGDSLHPSGGRDLLYSTADILTYSYLDDIILILYSKVGQTNEFAWVSRYGSRTIEVFGDTKVATNLRHADDGSGPLFPTYTWTQKPGKTVIRYPAPIQVWLLDEETAKSMYAPALTANSNILPTQQIFVLGPYLVRNATIEGNKVYVTGDNYNDTKIEVYIGKRGIKTINWNGRDLASSFSEYGSLVAKLPGTANRTVELPQLDKWRVADSLPEAANDFDDSKWTVCDKTQTASPIKPNTLPVLYSSDYGYYPGIKIYRGHFDGKDAKSVNLTASGGLAAGWTAWLNGQLLGGHPGDAKQTMTSATLDLGQIPLLDKNNALTVVVDYSGHDTAETGFGIENPRGLLDATLVGDNRSALDFTQWKIVGNAKGSLNGTEQIESVRGPWNEGGLYGERLGWHLPGYDTSAWNTSSPSTPSSNKAGISFYVTNFTLNIDDDLDVPLGIDLVAPEGKALATRVQLFMNGWQFGKYWPVVGGPQTRFPIPPGIINNRGANTLALSVWNMVNDDAALQDVKLIAYGAYESSFNFTFDATGLQPRWNPARAQYA